MKQKTPEQQLIEAGFHVRYSGISALFSYYRKDGGSILDLETDADLIELSTLFDRIDFAGEERIDAVIQDDTAGDRMCNIRIIDSGQDRPASAWKPLHFSYIPAERKFHDPEGMYQAIRGREPVNNDMYIDKPDAMKYWWYNMADLAELSACFDWDIDSVSLEKPMSAKDPDLLGSREQLRLLTRLVEASNPGKGFTLLMDSGFISAHWPLLASMRGVIQDKDFHPEGDVWDHTVEMFRYLKQPDPDIAMGILLHDCGKAFASKQNNNEFDRHAQIGAGKGARFLAGLGFGQDFINRNHFLVNNHMLPAHIPNIPVHSIEEILDDPLFPKLLEIFRCDISSSFRDPDGYYRSCEYYRRYKRHSKNPYRKNDGTLTRKKRNRVPLD